MTSNVVTLQPTTDVTGHTTLEQIGIVEGIAPNETIWSARFVEDRAYIVTFEKWIRFGQSICPTQQIQQSWVN